MAAKKSEKTVKYKQDFGVKGSGKFPLDMLRYDTCVPMSSGDVALMEGRGERVIHLTRFSANPEAMPTAERWASFGWTVTV